MITECSETTLRALAVLCEKAVGPDRDLDALVAQHLFGWVPTRVGSDYDGQNACEILTPHGELYKDFAYPPRGRIHPAYHCEDYTRDCRDPAFPKDAVRKQLAASLRARAAQLGKTASVCGTDAFCESSLNPSSLNQPEPPHE